MPEEDLSVEPQSLTKHFNEALILSSLERGPKHGYQLALDIEEGSEGRFGFKHGTLYPLLHKLEGDHLIRGEWTDEGPRGKRKQYRLTPRGQQYLRTLRDSWTTLLQRFTDLMGEGKS